MREEIRKKLWPNNTVVEFEHSISAAMNRLRQALGDSGENRRYIETLARRGYRWLVPVEWTEMGPRIPATESRETGEILTGKKFPTTAYWKCWEAAAWASFTKPKTSGLAV